MRALVVIKADPSGNDTAGVQQGFESVAVPVLVFERADHALDHAVLLRAVRGDELLLQTVAAASEHQAIAANAARTAWPLGLNSRSRQSRLAPVPPQLSWISCCDSQMPTQ